MMVVIVKPATMPYTKASVFSLRNCNMIISVASPEGLALVLEAEANVGLLPVCRSNEDSFDFLILL